jgi:hypothetical protein
MYNGLATISDKFALFAHAEVMKSCEAPESNRMMIGCPNSKKVPCKYFFSLSNIFDHGVVNTTTSRYWVPELTFLLNYH